jgi:hypothetical protein
MDDIFKSRTSVILVSVIWGLGLATLFNFSCKKGRDCNIIEYVGPPKDIATKVWSYGEKDKCYNINPVITSCNK